MNKNRIKILGIAVLITSLVFSTAYAMEAPSKLKEAVTTGRTEQGRETGIITCTPVDVPHYADTVTLSGKVVIDGPQLVLKVDGKDVTALANVKKGENQTWTYSYTASLNDRVGDVVFKLEAYTIYENGTPASEIHTYAKSVSQTVHVPFVKSFEYANLTWDDYDRPLNTFKFSYNLIKIWDNNDKETINPRVAASVLGTEKYTITASDKTHNSGATVNVALVTPPVKVKDFTSSEGTFANYNKETNTYDLTFTLHRDFSNGTSSDEKITAKVEASKTYVYTAEDKSLPGAPYSEEFKFTAPAAPAAPVLTVKSAVAKVTNQEELANNQDKNNYKVTYDLTITLSDGTTKVFKDNVITIPYNKGNDKGSKNVTKTLTIDGKSYTVTYTVTLDPFPTKTVK